MLTGRNTEKALFTKHLYGIDPMLGAVLSVYQHQIPLLAKLPSYTLFLQMSDKQEALSNLPKVTHANGESNT